MSYYTRAFQDVPLVPTVKSEPLGDIPAVPTIRFVPALGATAMAVPSDRVTVTAGKAGMVVGGAGGGLLGLMLGSMVGSLIGKTMIGSLSGLAVGALAGAYAGDRAAKKAAVAAQDAANRLLQQAPQAIVGALVQAPEMKTMVSKVAPIGKPGELTRLPMSYDARMYT